MSKNKKMPWKKKTKFIVALVIFHVLSMVAVFVFGVAMYEKHEIELLMWGSVLWFIGGIVFYVFILDKIMKKNYKIAARNETITHGVVHSVSKVWSSNSRTIRKRI